MLIISKTKKIALSVAVVSAVAVPTAVFVTNNIKSTKDTFATAMPAGFNDQNFYNCVLASFQAEYPSETVPSSGLTDTQLAKIAELQCAGDAKTEDEKITDVSGLAKMTGLTELDVSNNNLTGILDVSSNTQLVMLYAHTNQLSGLNLGGINGLKKIEVGMNELSGTLDVSKNTSLEILYANTNKLSDINLGDISSLKDLRAHKNQLIGTFDISKNTGLETLSLFTNQLSGLNLGNISSLKNLSIGDNQLSGVFDVSKNADLEYLSIHTNHLTSLDVSHNTKLTTLGIHNNNLTYLDISNNPDLSNFYADDILISAGIEDEDLVNGQKTFDLSGLKFISTDGNTTIANTANYTFDNASKILSVKDIAATNGFVITSPIDTSLNNSEYRQYKLQIGKVAPDDSEDPGEDEDTDNPSQGDDDSASDGKDVVVPDTSAKTDGGKTTEATGAKTPNTGVTTKDDEDTASLISYLLPVLALTVVLLLAYAGGRKVFARKRINF